MIGVAGRTKRIRVERRAANRASLLSPDASGKRRASLALDPGPAYRVAAASPARLIRLLRKHRLPCALSQDAGRYLCNACYSSALAEPVPVLLLHIPKPPRRKPRRKARHRTPRTNWHDRLAAGFVDVAIDLLTMSRREPRSRTPPCGSSGVACSLADVTAPGRA
jgi:pyroglutamyl-peptidase